MDTHTHMPRRRTRIRRNKDENKNGKVLFFYFLLFRSRPSKIKYEWNLINNLGFLGLLDFQELN